jgi:hypothetical protein
VGRLNTGSGGLEQVADGTDVGVYILGIVHMSHTLKHLSFLNLYQNH